MRRQTGRRLGALVSLSLVLALGTAAGSSATDSSGTSARSAASASAARPDAVPQGRAHLRRVSGDRARSVARVDLPRPVHGARAVRLLGEGLDEAAALNDTTASELATLLRTDPTAWLDTRGAVFYKDLTALAPRRDPFAASAPLDQTFALHSRPGSRRTIYLDFDGGSASGTTWHQQHPAVPTTQPAWDLTGDPTTFDATERQAVQTVWASVAEDYAAFDVDVTTADPGPAAINRSSTSDDTYGSHVLVTPSVPAADAICASSCGGVAYRSVFDLVDGGAGDGYGAHQPAWIFPQLLGNAAKNIAEAVSHEVGHNLGLSHDGDASGGDYDSGHTPWAPIMGAGYYQPVTQWSKGDYVGANNQEDDLAIVRGVLGLRADEAGSSIAGAAALPTGSAYVSTRTDVDTYLLGTCSGAVSVAADVASSFADLDARLTLLDATGAVVATDDPASAASNASVATGMSAAISRSLPAGTYYASVDGVGNGPWSTGYDDYASTGAYSMAVSGCDGAAPTGTPSQPVGATATPDVTAPSVSLAWSAPADPGAGPVTGYLLTRSGDDGVVQLPAGATGYTWSGLDSSTAYTFTITALNARGPGASTTATASTATGVLRPGAPTAVTGTWDGVGQAAILRYAAPASSGSYPVTGYQVFFDGTLLGTTSATAVGFSPVAPGTHTLGVAAVSQAGAGPRVDVGVVAPPKAANDAFAQRSALAGATGTVSGDNLESSSEAGEPAPGAAARSGAGGASVWYSWTSPSTGPVTVTTGSDVPGRDTLLGVYVGSSVGALSTVAANDEPDATTRLASVRFDATAGTTYAIAVDGYRTSAAGVGPFSLTWTATDAGPQATASTLAVDVSGRSATLRAAVTASAGSPVGSVAFRDGSVLLGYGDVSTLSATPSLTVSDLVRGDHAFRATFVPDDSTAFAGSQSPVVTGTVAATATTTTLAAGTDAQQVSLSAHVTPDAGTAAGTVQFREGGSLVGTATVSGGDAALVLTGVAPGAHAYTATFVPADPDRYAGSLSAERGVTVAAPPPATPTTTTLTGRVDGRAATLTAVVRADAGDPAGPAGSVQLRDGSTVVATAPLAGGSATLTVDDLVRGTHHFRATYLPADPAGFATSDSADVALDVAATPTDTSLTAAVDGRTVTLETAVSPAAPGTVELRDGTDLVGSVALGGGAGRLVLADVPAGQHDYRASFVPADAERVAASTSPTRTVTVLATPTATALGASVDAHRVTLTATVTADAGAPAGTVQFLEGGTLLASSPLSGATAAATLADVPTGDHAYTARFVPAVPTSYAASASGERPVTVVATPTTTALGATATGRTVTLTATPAAASGTLAGRVEFREDTTLLGTRDLGTGSPSLELSGVTPGAHGYTATFVPSGTSHAGSTSTVRTVTVRVTSATTLDASVAGRDVTLAASVATDGGQAAGTVELREGASLVGTVGVQAGQPGTATLTLAGVAPGDHVYQASFVPADPASYAGSASATRTVTVDRVATSTDLAVAVDARTVALTATPGTGTTSGSLTGSVEFREGGTLLGTRSLSGGTAVLTLAGVVPGTHAYTATFVPTGTTYAGSTSPERTATVDRVATSTGLTASVDGRSVLLAATVTAGATGSVEFREGDALLGTVPLAGGARLQLDGVEPGTHTYTATFVPTGDVYAASTSPQRAATVAPVATATALAAAVDARTVTLTATTSTAGAAGLAAPAGVVELREGDTLLDTVPLEAGAAVLVLSDVAVGTHTYTATFVPTGTTYAGSSSAPRTVPVDRTATVTTLTATADGRSVALDASVSAATGSPTGDVVLRDGGTVVATGALNPSGTLTLTLDDVDPGDHSYTATYVPSGTVFGGSASPARTVTVPRIATTTDLVAALDAGSVVLTATPAVAVGGTEQPTGSVELREDDVLLATRALTGASVQLDLGARAPGVHTYTATYVPTGTRFAGSTSPERTVSVPRVVSTTGLDVVVDHQQVGLDATVTVASGAPRGSVVLRDGDTVLDTVPVLGGHAGLSLDDVRPGQHAWTATFVPDDAATYAGSVSPVRSATVDPISTTTDLSATVEGRTVTLDATVTGGRPAPAGSVVLREGDGVVGRVALDAGAARLVLTGVEPGEHGYTATFVPDDPALHQGSTSPERGATVDPIPTATDLAARVAGRTVSLVATTTAESGPLAGDVELTEDGVPAGTAAVGPDGTARLDLTGVAPGTHTYRAYFRPGGPRYRASESPERTVAVDLVATTTGLAVEVAGRAVTLSAVVLPADDTPVVGDVVFREGGTELGTVAAEGGRASLALDGVDPGQHTYTATYVPGGSALAGSTSPTGGATVDRIGTATELGVVVDVRRVTLDATVASADGVPDGDVVLREGDTVLATVPLDAGRASLTLERVEPGEHGYTATYVPAGGRYAGSASEPRTGVVDPIVTATDLAADVEGRTVSLVASAVADSGTLAGRVELREGDRVLDTLPLDAGTAALTLRDVLPGDHTYVAVLLPADPATYAGSSSPERAVRVERVTTATDLIVSLDGRTVTLDARTTTGAGSLSGEVEFRQDGDPVATVVVPADATGTSTSTVTTTVLRHVVPGDHVFSATFASGDGVHGDSTSPDRTATVSSAPVATVTTLRTSVAGRTVTLDAAVTSAEGTPDGAMQIRDGDQLVETLFTTNGELGWQLDRVAPGTHRYMVTFVPDDAATYAGSTSPVSTADVAALPTTTVLTAGADGARVTLSAQVTGDGGVSEGTVEFREGGTTLGSASVAGGAATLQVSGVLGGTHTYTATYVPAAGGTYAASASGSSPVTVAPTATTTVLATSVAQRTVTLTAGVTAVLGAPGGTVAFRDGVVVVATVPLTSGGAVVVLPAVASGDHRYAATFVPADPARHAGSTGAAAVLTLAPSATTTALTAVADATTVTLDAALTSPDGVPTGVVTMLQDGAEVARAVADGGRLRVVLTGVAPGAHTYTARFADDSATYAGSTSAARTVQVVDPTATIGTTTRLDVAVLRRTVTLTAGVTAASGTPAGAVEFAQDGVVLEVVPASGGAATLTRTAVGAGTHRWTATFVPADPSSYAASVSAEKSGTVAPTVTTTALTGTVSGSTVSLAVGVTGTDGIVPDGTVQVLDGTTPVGAVVLTAGRGSLVLAGAAVGPHAYRAVFAGGADLAGSSSGTLALAVAAPVLASRTTLTVPRTARVGSRPVVKVKVLRGTLPASGKVVLTYGTRSTTLTLRAGAASFTLPSLRRGTLKVSARYLGNATTKASSAAASMVVK